MLLLRSKGTFVVYKGFTLLLYIHHHPRLELQSEPVLIDRNLFNQPPNLLLIIFGNGGGCSRRNARMATIRLYSRRIGYRMPANQVG